MKDTIEVTIAIPTFNRGDLLKFSLKSALAQDHPDFQILVLDNASIDDTEDIVRSFADSRITYIRNETNIGLFRNWNRAIELNSSPYLCLLQDDDMMLPGFIRESVMALEKYSQAAFSFVQTQCVDINGNPLNLFDSRHVSDSIPTGLIDGLEYLHQIVAGRKWIIRVSSVMMRASALESIGPFDTSHSKRSIELNLYYRLARQFDLISIHKELIQVRFHEEQDSQADYNLSGGTGALATVAERTDAIAYLLQSTWAEDVFYRQWLAERLLHISGQRSELTAELLPELNLNWSERLQIATQEITNLIPEGTSFILVDEASFGIDGFAGRSPMPFLESDGQYLGPPPDDETSISELERMRQAGAKFIVFGWPAFWWLDYYSGLRDYLYSMFHCALKNSRLLAFDLEV